MNSTLLGSQHRSMTTAISYVQMVVMRGGLEELEQDDPPLALLVENAHQMEGGGHQVQDEQGILQAEMQWNQDDGPEDAGMGEQAPPGPVQAQQPAGPDIDGGVAQHGPVPPPVHAQQAEDPLQGAQRQALPGEARWFQENPNERPVPGARATNMQIIMSTLTLLGDKSVHQIVFDLFMQMVSDALPEGNSWPRCATISF